MYRASSSSSISASAAACVHRRQCRPRPLQRAVDRRHRCLEKLGDLRRLPVQHLAEDERGPLARRKVLERGDEREPDRLVRDRHVGRVRSREDPGRLAPRVQVVEDRLLSGAEIHRARTPLAPVQRVEADIRRDPVEPRAQGRAALEAVDRPPGADECLLHRVLGLERRAEHAVAVGNERAPMLLELLLQLGSRHLQRFHDSHPMD